MILRLDIIRESENSTLSTLSIDGEFFCYVLEDGYNFPKIKGETRIPHGVNKIITRKEGKFFNRYNARYEHPFSLHLMDVVNFSQVLIHIGNTIIDTRGCLLVGMSWGKDRTTGDYIIRRSTDAYKTLFGIISQAVADGECWIIVDRSCSDYEKQDAILDY
jgi:hypothetical protein